MRPRRKYLGEEFHKIVLEQQHKAFVTVYKRLKAAKKKQTDRANKDNKTGELEVSDPRKNVRN